MNLTGKFVWFPSSVLLLACAGFAGYQTFGFAFGMGESGGPQSALAAAFLLGTLFGGAGLVIAALGSWSHWRPFSFIAMVSVMVVFPASVLFGRQDAWAMWVNSGLGYYFGAWRWSLAILPPFVDSAALWLSWVRFRELGRPAN
jgi:hypothetical protein